MKGKVYSLNTFVQEYFLIQYHRSSFIYFLFLVFSYCTIFTLSLNRFNFFLPTQNEFKLLPIQHKTRKAFFLWGWRWVLGCHLVVLFILPTCEKLLHLIFDRGICVLPLPGKMLKSDWVMTSKVQFLLGFSIRLNNLLHLMLLGPNLVQLGLDPC